MRPPEDLKVSEWADKHRILSTEGSAEPGRWSTDRAPYQRGIMDSMNDDEIREVVVMKSAQIGWTELLLNVIGFHIDREPAPMLMLQPTIEMAQTISKDRITPMLRDSPALRNKVGKSKYRDSAETILHKTFGGGHLTLAGANSPASLASRPVRIVLCDEVDRYPPSAGTEGDPISLARKRSTTFWNRKLLMGSTPTVKGQSRIEQAYEASDKRRYYVPCPHCGTYQALEWPNVRWPEGEPRKAYYACPECAGVITDRDKPAMLKAGEWRATSDSDGVAGFHLCELYSPWVSFGDTAAAFVEAKKTPETLQTWVNTSLGETWVERGDAPTHDRVLQLRRDYASGEVPDGALVLTAGVDVQKDRCIYVVRAWGHYMASWLVEFGDVWGDTAEPEVWQRLADVLSGEYGGKHVRLALIDSGFRADQVYAFCRANPVSIAAKGQETASAPVKSSRVDVTLRGATIKQGAQLWHVDTGYFKTLVHGRIDWPADQPGAWHLPSDISEDYARQLIAESKITLPSGRAVWKRHDRENHALDCDVYATAAARIIGMDRVRPPKPKAEPEDQPSQQAVQRPSARPIRGGFVSRWR
jgi:phage terminase large subunit GpA-like protein